MIYIWTEYKGTEVCVSNFSPMDDGISNDMLERHTTRIPVPKGYYAASVKNPLFNILCAGAPGMVEDLGDY